MSKKQNKFETSYGILLDLDEIYHSKFKKFPRGNPWKSLPEVRETTVLGVAKAIRKFGFPYVKMIDTYAGSGKIGISLISDTDDYEIKIDISVAPILREANEIKK